MARARAAASRPADRSDLFNDRRHGARLPHPHELLVPDPAGPVTRTSAGKRSQVGFSKLYPKWDVNPAKNPQAFQQGIRNLAAVHHLTKEHYPEEFEEGPRWHEEVHKGVTRTIRGTKMTHEQGSGILAVISAGSDWRQQNVPGLESVMKLNKRQWGDIHHAAESGQKTPEMRGHLRGTPLESVTAANLVRAHAIHAGAHPLDVISSRTSPKEWHFYHSLEHPHEPVPATIDFRAHDLVINSMYPSQYSGRGISLGHTQRGTPTRHQDFQEVYGQAAHLLGYKLPHHLQASTWLGGKRIETSPPTAAGTPRTKGVARRGQPYFHPEEG